MVTMHDGLSFALLFDLVFVSALVALMFIDAAHQILPDVITLPGLAFVLVVGPRGFVKNTDAFGRLSGPC